MDFGEWQKLLCDFINLIRPSLLFCMRSRNTHFKMFVKYNTVLIVNFLEYYLLYERQANFPSLYKQTWKASWISVCYELTGQHNLEK